MRPSSIDQVWLTIDIDEFKHRQITRAAHAGMHSRHTIAKVDALPPLRHRLSVSLTDHRKESSSDEVVDRPTRQGGCLAIGRADLAAFIEADHCIWQVVEQLAQVRLSDRKLVDRRP